MTCSRSPSACTWKSHSITELIDTNTPNGRLFFSVAGAFAQFERDVIQERTLEGLAAAQAAGKKAGPK